MSNPKSKIVSLSDALETVTKWQRTGACVGFTNGCFDLLHPGHTALLEQGRAACDQLIVGLNSDTSVRRLKGAGRPIQEERTRAEALAALEPVDLVVLFSEDTPILLIEGLRPNVLIKGADYRRDQVVGGDFVESYGGRVLLATLLKGQSTSKKVTELNR